MAGADEDGVLGDLEEPRREPLAADRRTGPSLIRSPSKVVQAPGRECTPDPAVDGDRRVGPVDACGPRPGPSARDEPSLGCSRALEGAVLDAVEGLHQQRAPPSARRASRSPAVSVGRTVSVITPNAGPASSSLTMRKVVAPVTSSPAQIACCTGAAPRQDGRTEKCRLTQPWSGRPARDRGSSAPYATTAQQSGRERLEGASKAESRGGPASGRYAEGVGALRHRGEDQLAPAARGGVESEDHPDQLVAGGRRQRRATGGPPRGYPRRRRASF